MESLLTPDEVARILGFDKIYRKPREAVRLLRLTGRIAYYKIGKRIWFAEKDVKKFLEKNRTESI